MNAILYIATTGRQWAILPKEFPPYSTVQRCFYDWRDSGLLRTMRFALPACLRDVMPSGQMHLDLAQPLQRILVRVTLPGHHSPPSQL